MGTWKTVGYNVCHLSTTTNKMFVAVATPRENGVKLWKWMLVVTEGLPKNSCIKCTVYLDGWR